MDKQLYLTENGTPLYWEVTYNLGGTNFFGDKIPRGYSIFITRKPNSFRVMDRLDQENGSGRETLLEVTRRSEKQEALAVEKAKALLPKIAARFNL